MQITPQFFFKVSFVALLAVSTTSFASAATVAATSSGTAVPGTAAVSSSKGLSQELIDQAAIQARQLAVQDGSAHARTLVAQTTNPFSFDAFTVMQLALDVLFAILALLGWRRMRRMI